MPAGPLERGRRLSRKSGRRGHGGHGRDGADRHERNAPRPQPSHGRSRSTLERSDGFRRGPLTKVAPEGTDTSAAARSFARRSRAGQDVIFLYGYHTVREALRSSRRKVLKLRATEAAAARLGEEIAAKSVAVEIVPAEEIARRLPPDAVHQGVLLEARPLESIDISEIPPDGLVIVLDQVTDPHNVGAIVRTAAAFGVDAIVTTERHSPDFSGALGKAASGGLEHVPIAAVTNLARALAELGEMGYLRVGLDASGSEPLESIELRRPFALVLGAEGKGLRRLTRETCDALARLDVPGAIKTLNVSNACAVALAIVRMRLKASDGG
ncbi:MAG: RNA methyltransferase [Methylobacteriaceae bacterium]|nr:RNA methyltransferase [Methylobacteriaceae bacterium]